jgi:hypothetical protein
MGMGAGIRAGGGCGRTLLARRFGRGMPVRE